MWACLINKGPTSGALEVNLSLPSATDVQNGWWQCDCAGSDYDGSDYTGSDYDGEDARQAPSSAAAGKPQGPTLPTPPSATAGAGRGSFAASQRRS